MAEGDNHWRLGLDSKAPVAATAVQVEKAGEGYNLRAMWKGSDDYFGVDSRDEGSYIYTDKKEPVVFKFLTASETGVTELFAGTGDINVFDAEGKIGINVNGKAEITVANTDGIVIVKDKIEGTAFFPVSGNNVYIVSVALPGRPASIHKLAIK